MLEASFNSHRKWHLRSQMISDRARNTSSQTTRLSAMGYLEEKTSKSVSQTLTYTQTDIICNCDLFTLSFSYKLSGLYNVAELLPDFNQIDQNQAKQVIKKNELYFSVYSTVGILYGSFKKNMWHKFCLLYSLYQHRPETDYSKFFLYSIFKPQLTL